MLATTQAILNLSRNLIPDPKTRTKTVRGEYLGQITLPTGNRESFFIKQVPLSTVNLYVEPYMYSSTSSLGASGTYDKNFLFNGTLLSCTFPDGTIDTSIRPKKGVSVVAYYEYEEKLPYAYSDNELVGFLANAISYLNNTYNLSYSFTGTISTFDTAASSDDQKELFSRSLALIVKKSFLEETKRRGLGIKFNGPLQSIDSIQQMKDYRISIKDLEQSIFEFVMDNKLVHTSQVIDVYTETVVES